MTNFKQIAKVENLDVLKKLLFPIIHDNFHKRIGLESYSFKGRLANNEIIYGEGFISSDLTKEPKEWNIWKPGWETGDLLNFIPQFDKEKISRIRLINLLAHSCYSWHKDPNLKIHIPIHTNQFCKMIVDNEIECLTEGYIWFVNTKNMHTAFNGNKSEFNRIHLIYDYHGDWHDNV